MLIARLEQAVGFANRLLHRRAAPERILRGARHRAGGARPARRDRSRPRARASSSSTTSRSPMTASAPAVADLNFTALPGETIALVGADRRRQVDRAALLHRAFDPQSGSIKIDGMDIRDFKLAALRRNIGVVFQEALLFNRSIAENLRVGKPDATDEEIARRRRARAGARFHRAQSRRLRGQGRRARPLAVGRRAPAPVDRARAAEKPADPDPRRGDQRARRHHRAAKVQAALDEVMKDRTTFVIAHRLADRAQRDAHPGVRRRAASSRAARFDELLRLGGRFAALAKAQFMSVVA